MLTHRGFFLSKAIKNSDKKVNTQKNVKTLTSKKPLHVQSWFTNQNELLIVLFYFYVA